MSSRDLTSDYRDICIFCKAYPLFPRFFHSNLRVFDLGVSLFKRAPRLSGWLFGGGTCTVGFLLKFCIGQVYLVTRSLLGWRCMAGFVPKMGKSQKIVETVGMLHKNANISAYQASDRGRTNTMQLLLNSFKTLCKSFFCFLTFPYAMLHPLRKSVLKVHRYLHFCSVLSIFFF